MTTCTVSLRTAIIIVKIREMAIPMWKRWCLRNPGKDRVQRRTYYRRNRDEIDANSRIRYLVKKGVNCGRFKRTGTGGSWVGWDSDTFFLGLTRQFGHKMALFCKMVRSLKDKLDDLDHNGGNYHEGNKVEGLPSVRARSVFRYMSKDTRKQKKKKNG